MTNRTAKETFSLLEWIGGATMLAALDEQTGRRDPMIKDRGLIFRAVLRNDQPDGARRYAAWMKRATDQSGVYIIRANGSGEILYIGESHTDRLKETLTRHFRSWQDSAERIHFTFDPAAVAVAVRYTSAGDAVHQQNELIAELGPKFNTNDGGSTEAAAEEPAEQPF